MYDKATVPSIQFGPDFTLGDSIPVCRWIDDNMEGPKIYPSSTVDAHSLELVLNKFGSKIIGPCYKLLLNKDPSADRELAQKVMDGCEWFNNCLALRGIGPGPDGKKFFAEGKFGMFEILTCSFFDRFRNTLKHWRGLDLITDSLSSLSVWMAAVDASPAFMHTCREGDFYILCYARYAQNQQRKWDALPEASSK